MTRVFFLKLVWHCDFNKIWILWQTMCNKLCPPYQILSCRSSYGRPMFQEKLLLTYVLLTTPIRVFGTCALTHILQSELELMLIRIFSSLLACFVYICHDPHYRICSGPPTGAEILIKNLTLLFFGRQLNTIQTQPVWPNFNMFLMFIN